MLAPPAWVASVVRQRPLFRGVAARPGYVSSDICWLRQRDTYPLPLSRGDEIECAYQPVCWYRSVQEPEHPEGDSLPDTIFYVIGCYIGIFHTFDLLCAFVLSTYFERVFAVY